MKLLHVLFFIIICGYQANTQTVNWKKLNQLDPDKILIDPANLPTKALLLGSFHFSYPNLDGHKTDSSKMMDVLSPRRQKEIRQLVDVLASFKPTRIYVESVASAILILFTMLTAREAIHWAGMRETSLLSAWPKN
ncbi:hypothetical protein [Paraflavitalea speifideaquila]|uniref:hypothetical protein n=1 Tax=Paraflavitalea speifideaquila TaxID=3076558 RepID=UPI0028E87ADE|nr:hypothetical protein [Paraflavitalea speifideiaquila]